MVSKNLNPQVAEDFIKSLDATTELVQQLLEDIREGEIDFASIKKELQILVENVKELSVVMKDNELKIHHLETRVALLEKIVKDLEEWVKYKQHLDQDIKLSEHKGKWQLITAIAAGIIALITSLVTLFISTQLK